MPAIERSIQIQRPAAEVFAYLADFSRHHEWAAHRLEVQQTSEGSVSEGTTFRSIGHQGGLNFKNENVVTELVPNERIAFESEAAAGRFRNAFVLREDDGHTLLVKRVGVVRAKALLGPILALFLPLAGGALDKDLRRIKAKLEGEA